jgi:hypothetical protein
MGMGMGVNLYPPVYMGDPVRLFLCRGYVYGVVIPGGYLPIAISSPTQSAGPPLTLPLRGNFRPLAPSAGGDAEAAGGAGCAAGGAGRAQDVASNPTTSSG